MSHRSPFVAAAVAACLVAGIWLAAPARTAPAPAATRWEYKVIGLTHGDSPHEMEEKLSKLGDAGWEVVAASNQSGPVTTSPSDAKLILKRLRP